MKYLLTGLLLLSGLALKAQHVDLSTPQATMTVFVDNIVPSNYKPKEAAPIIQGKGLFGNVGKRAELCEMLKQILDKDSIYIVLKDIPNDSNYVAPDSDSLNRYTIANHIYLDKVGDKWYLSQVTVDSLEILYAAAGFSFSKNKTDKKEEVTTPVVTKPVATTTRRVPVDISTPRKALRLFLVNTEADSTNLKMASRIIYRRYLTNESDRIKRIEMLSRFFAGTGVLIDLNNVTDDPNYIDSLNLDKAEYEISYRYPELFLEKIGKSWYLSKSSTEVLPEMYEKKFPFGSDRLFKYLPDASKKEIGTLKIWQYVGILLLTILGSIAYKLFAYLTSQVLVKTMARFSLKDLTTKYIKPVVSPLGYFLVVYFVAMFVPILMLPVKVTFVLSNIVAILGPLFFIVAIYRLMDIIGLLLVRRANKSENAMDDQLAPIIRKALKAFVVIIGFIYILQNLNIDIMPLLAGLSIGGLALALAAQDTIKQFFGSLMIFLDKPFQVGQWISTTTGIDGTVEEVGIRATRIRTFSNSVVYVPNGQLSDSVINNHGLRHYRRFKTTISITYDTPPDLIQLYVDGLRKIVMDHPHTRKDLYHIYLNSMGSHSLDIMFYIFFKTPAWAEELTYRHEIIMSTISLAYELGINFAFPTQTLQVETLPGQPSLSPEYTDADSLRPKMDEYLITSKNKDGEK